MNRMWSVFTIPCLVLTVVPSTIGRMSRCTPSRLTSGPCRTPPSRLAILSISSTKMMPFCSTRSTARRLTDSMSTSLACSSATRCSSASGTFMRRVRPRPWKSDPIMSFRFEPISSIDDPATTSNDGIGACAASISTVRSSSRCVAQLLAQPLARAARRVDRRAGRVGRGRGHAARRRQQQVQQPLLGGLPRLLLHLLGLLRPHHVHGQLHQVAHHRFDVAADVADLGELRRLDLDERRLRQPRQPPGDLGLADAGRADHQDVLRRHLLGDVGRQPLPAHAVAQRDGHGALGLGLADDELVELGDDLPRRQRADRRCAALGKKDGHGGLQLFDREGPVGVDADLAGDRHRLLGDLAGARDRCGAPAPAPRPARTDRRIPRPRCRRRARSGRRCPTAGRWTTCRRRSASPRAAAGCGRCASPCASSTADAFEVAAVLFQLGFEAREQREGVGGRPGEPRQDRVVVEAPDLPRALLHARCCRRSPGRRRPARSGRRGAPPGWSSRESPRQYVIAPVS